jgi:ribonuclease III
LRSSVSALRPAVVPRVGDSRAGTQVADEQGETTNCAQDALADRGAEQWERVRRALDLPAGVPSACLSQAFCHASYVRETGAGPQASNQRLEFLGDAVLDLILADHLYATFPKLPEGRLTKMKATAVRAETLARVAQRLDLGSHLLLGRGEEDTGGRSKPSLLADCLEALVGAVYLGAGLEGAREFVLARFAEEVGAIEVNQSAFDHKTALQELLQELAKQTPTYRTLETSGAPHERSFVVGVEFAGIAIGRGEGLSKRTAQQSAAGNALTERESWLPAIRAALGGPAGADGAADAEEGSRL